MMSSRMSKQVSLNVDFPSGKRQKSQEALVTESNAVPCQVRLDEVRGMAQGVIKLIGLVSYNELHHVDNEESQNSIPS